MRSLAYVNYWVSKYKFNYLAVVGKVDFNYYHQILFTFSIFPDLFSNLNYTQNISIIELTIYTQNISTHVSKAS